MATHTTAQTAADALDLTRLAAASPERIDTALAAVYERANAVQATIARTRSHLTSEQEGWEKRQAGDRRYSSYSPETIERLTARLADLRADHAQVMAEADPLHAEYDRRGGWTRAFLVRNSGGHVHSTMACTTCFPTTEFGWLPQYSGHSEDEIVDDAGESACTVCYPSAPVETLSRPSRIEEPDKRAARLAREQAKAEREAKRIAKALLPSGESLRLTGRFHGSDLSTLASATMWLTAAAEWKWDHPSLLSEDVEAVLAAVSTKTGKPVEQVRAEADKRAARRR